MSVITKPKIKTKSWTAVITYSVLDMGRECDTEEEYIEMVKDHFKEEHNIELNDNEINDIEFDEVEYDM